MKTCPAAPPGLGSVLRSEPSAPRDRPARLSTARGKQSQTSPTDPSAARLALAGLSVNGFSEGSGAEGSLSRALAQRNSSKIKAFSQATALEAHSRTISSSGSPTPKPGIPEQPVM